MISLQAIHAGKQRVSVPTANQQGLMQMLATRYSKSITRARPYSTVCPCNSMSW